ncbi:Protein N-terminal and lysine N-methyltransferase efm7 [Marasmius crinis-equi]|uniref:Protein N-terminal and lysine N-methyltransferase EFM7 n=1 Tax=Marasmius crinis-equi TaxID=585013 RepID=A0ABR3EYN2_9AGAR
MSNSDDGDLDLNLDSVFPEPPRPPTPDPTVSVYNRIGSKGEVRIRLVGSHPLWGHYLWNSALCLASYFDENAQKLCRNRFVLELGAGGGLPSIIAALNGAQKVVITDYPDTSLVDNMQHNVDQNIKDSPMQEKISVQGYIWGTPVKPIMNLLPSEEGFDLIILSDLIFNHSQHNALLKTCEESLRLKSPKHTEEEEPCVLVFYTHHRPHLAHRDMEFFDKARDRGWNCVKIVEKKYPPMFPEDPGAEEVRSTVHGWRLKRIEKESH